MKSVLYKGSLLEKKDVYQKIGVTQKLSYGYAKNFSEQSFVEQGVVKQGEKYVLRKCLELNNLHIWHNALILEPIKVQWPLRR